MFDISYLHILWYYVMINYNIKIYIFQLQFTTTQVIGTGWFTYYYNSVGQENHKLVYGDCATKESYDNCLPNTIVVARNLNNGNTASFRKYDAGGLPEAVLDIWGTGITQLTDGGKQDNVYNGYMVHDRGSL